MGLYDSIFIALLTISGLVSLPIGGYIYRYRGETIGGRLLVLIFAGQALWSFTHAVQLTSSQASFWLALERVVVTGATIAIAGWFVFVLTYTGYKRRLSDLQLTTLLLPFGLGLLLAWTNRWHGLFWQLQPRPEVLAGAGGRYLVFEPGLTYRPWLIYLFLVVFAALIMLGAKYVHSRSLHRAQVGLIFVAVLIPFVGNLAFNVVEATTLAIDITPILFTVTSVLVVVALHRYRMLDSVPVSEHVLLEQLSHGIVVTDETGEIIHANRAARDVFGHELVGEQLSSYLPQELEADDERATSAADLSIDVDGRRRHFDVQRRPYSDHRGDPRGAIYLFQDVTVREERTAELARQNERLDKFASVVSHDLRNPLNVASSRLRLARNERDSDNLEEVDTALERMNTLIDDLLSLARLGEPIDTRQAVQLSEVGEQCWAVIETKHATLTIESDLTLLADPDRLRQLLENLIRNAIDHGGEDVSIRIGKLADTKGFYLADDGPGLELSDTSELFEFGYSTTENGTGFGMAIVSDIATAHGWTIDVTESRSGGARFEITGVEVVE